MEMPHVTNTKFQSVFFFVRGNNPARFHFRKFICGKGHKDSRPKRRTKDPVGIEYIFSRYMFDTNGRL